MSIINLHHYFTIARKPSICKIVHSSALLSMELAAESVVCWSVLSLAKVFGSIVHVICGLIVSATAS
jgi:hypothetical protein